MQETIFEIKETQFEKDVRKGLTDFPKHLSSKYFYDQKGDAIFQQIMHMPEYYLTGCEYQIFKEKKYEIAQMFAEGGQPFKLIELGAGDGKKTKVLLQEFVHQNLSFKYQPIDISHHVLEGLEKSLLEEIPQVNVVPKQGTYFEALKELSDENGMRKIIMFLGSNIGNLLHHQAILFLKDVQKLMNTNDLLFIGCDLKKNPQTILDAYNDASGITEAFNKNLLSRINTEMDADFDLDEFKHWEVYNPETGTAKSYLVAKKAQKVRIASLDLTVNFEPWETIHTEISQKYDDTSMKRLAQESGLEICDEFTDEKRYFKNYVLKTVR